MLVVRPEQEDVLVADRLSPLLAEHGIGNRIVAELCAQAITPSPEPDWTVVVGPVPIIVAELIGDSCKGSVERVREREA